MADEQTLSNSSGAVAARLKNNIDNGRTGDKAAGFDPAAAPLGTDDEAGGASADPVHTEARLVEQQGRPSTPKPNAAEPALAPDGNMRRGSFFMPIIIGVAAAIVIALLFALSL